jgi:hypothetical protein
MEQLDSHMLPHAREAEAMAAAFNRMDSTRNFQADAAGLSFLTCLLQQAICC